MNLNSIKFIYREVLKYKSKIEYLGEDKYKITRYYLNGQKRWEFEYKTVYYMARVYYGQQTEQYFHAANT